MWSVAMQVAERVAEGEPVEDIEVWKAAYDGDLEAVRKVTVVFYGRL